VGAVLTAVLIWDGVLDSTIAQLIFFSVSSVVLLIALRRYFSKYLKGDVSNEGKYKITEEEFIGKRVKVVKRIEPDSVDGRIEFEGTIWNADSDEIIEPGTMAEITGKDNITFNVKITQ
jgi:membrane protein implicated in regulation of membrane protease activity